MLSSHEVSEPLQYAHAASACILAGCIRKRYNYTPVVLRSGGEEQSALKEMLSAVQAPFVASIARDSVPDAGAMECRTLKFCIF
jgi:hypothetical protein